jgi:pimeloyl-ACP methyl ester carboxylesterase
MSIDISPERGNTPTRGQVSRRTLFTGIAGAGVLGLLHSDTPATSRGPMTYESQFPEMFVHGSEFNPDSEPLLNQNILDTQREYFDQNKEYLREAFWQSKTVIDLGDRAFVASIVRGESDSAVVSAAEYGNPLNRLGVVRHLGVRAVVDPQATSIYLPANIRGQNNLNYSADEREHLDRGDHSPFTRRVEAVLGYAGVRGPIHAYGLSQSADFMPAWAINTDHEVLDLALIETPFLEDQFAVDSMLRVALSAGQLEEYYEMSRLGNVDEALTNDGTFSFNDFVLGALFDPDNQAMLTFMNERNVAKDIVQFRKDRPDAGLVMVSGGRSQVSPPAKNRAIARAMQGTRSEFHEAGNANHDMTNAYGVVAAASLRAYELAA